MATFNFKSVDDKKWFLNLLDGDDGLSVTRKAEGNGTKNKKREK